MLSPLLIYHSGFRIIETQNVWGWKRTLETVQSNPPAQPGSPEQVAQNLVLNISRKGDSTTSLAAPSSAQSYSKFFIIFRWNANFQLNKVLPIKKKTKPNYFQEEFHNSTSLSPTFPALAEGFFVCSTTPFLIIQKPFFNPLSFTSYPNFS